MIGRGLSGSAIFYAQALSPVALATAGSTAAFDLSNYQYGAVLIAAGALGGSISLTIERSATSNGTFGEFGATASANAAGTLTIRNFVANSSAVWHRVAYDNTDAGSVTAAILLIGHGARSVPITQDSNTTVLTEVNA